MQYEMSLIYESCLLHTSHVSYCNMHGMSYAIWNAQYTWNIRVAGYKLNIHFMLHITYTFHIPWHIYNHIHIHTLALNKPSLREAGHKFNQARLRINFDCFHVVVMCDMKCTWNIYVGCNMKSPKVRVVSNLLAISLDHHLLHTWINPLTICLDQTPYYMTRSNPVLYDLVEPLAI